MKRTIEQEAIWFARRRDPRAARMDDAFRTWLVADPRNAVRYSQCELAWERAGELVKDEDIARLLKAADAKVSRTSARPRGIRWAAAAAIALAVGSFLSWRYLSPATYQTAVGEQRDVLLPDGSRVTLNTATRVAVKYGADARRIELAAGEALFDVRKDPLRPFEVIADRGIARAIGTRFTVQRTAEGITVSVLDGIVEVERQGGSVATERAVPALERGQSTLLTRDGSLSPVRAANLRRIQAWQDRKLDFEAEPLAAAVAEVNRYSKRPLVLGRPELGSIRVSGVFRLNELDGFAFALRKSFGLRVVESADELLLLPAQEPSDKSLL